LAIWLSIWNKSQPNVKASEKGELGAASRNQQWKGPIAKLVMPGLVPGIHALASA
jgi:hypothetical protein